MNLLFVAVLCKCNNIYASLSSVAGIAVQEAAERITFHISLDNI